MSLGSYWVEPYTMIVEGSFYKLPEALLGVSFFLSRCGERSESRNSLTI